MTIFATPKVTLDRNFLVDQTAMENAMDCFYIHLDLKLLWNVFKAFYLFFPFSIAVSAFITCCICFILF